MRTAFNNLTVIQNDNFICVFRGRDTLCDNKFCTVKRKSVQALLNKMLGFHVDR